MQDDKAGSRMTDWKRCMKGSCQRHQLCMYTPCRAPQTIVRESAKRAVPLNDTIQIQLYRTAEGELAPSVVYVGGVHWKAPRQGEWQVVRVTMTTKTICDNPECQAEIPERTQYLGLAVHPSKLLRFGEPLSELVTRVRPGGMQFCGLNCARAWLARFDSA